MSDQLRIKGLEVRTSLGVPDEERSTHQVVVINADISLSLSQAGDTDDLSRTVDYGALIGAIEALAAQGERYLLERLAEEVAQLILDHDGVSSVTVEIGKANVPVPQKISAVSVRIRRVRSGPASEDRQR